MMHTDLKPYDPADLLKTEDDIYAYLNDALNDEDPAVFIIALADVVKMKGLAAVAEVRRPAPRNSLPSDFWRHQPAVAAGPPNHEIIGHSSAGRCMTAVLNKTQVPNPAARAAP